MKCLYHGGAHRVLFFFFEPRITSQPIPFNVEPRDRSESKAGISLGI